MRLISFVIWEKGASAKTQFQEHMRVRNEDRKKVSDLRRGLERSSLLCGSVLLFLVLFLGGSPYFDELDPVDPENGPHVADDLEPGHDPVLVELCHVGDRDGHFVLGDVECEPVGGPELGLQDGLGLLGRVLDGVGDGEPVDQVVSREGAVEVHLDTSGGGRHDGPGAVAEGDPEAGERVDLLFVELFVAVHLDELGVPGAGGLFAGDRDLGHFSGLSVPDGLLEGGEEHVGACDVDHGLVGELLVECARFLGLVLFGGVEELHVFGEIRAVSQLDDLLRVLLVSGLLLCLGFSVIFCHFISPNGNVGMQRVRDYITPIKYVGHARDAFRDV